MDGNIEEILAPLRLAVKEQVRLVVPTVMDFYFSGLCSLFIASDVELIACLANRLTCCL